MKPVEGEPKTKSMNNKTYHWCPNHQCWTVHTPAECQGKGSKVTPKSQDKGKTIAWSGKTKAPSLKVAKALQAIAGDDLEDPDED